MPAWVDPCPSGVGCIPAGGSSALNPLTVTDINLQGNYTINSTSVTWTGLNIRMTAPGTSITIAAGCTLRIVNCHIAAFPTSGPGILGNINITNAAGNSRLEIIGSCIEDFTNAVNNANKNDMVIGNSEFNNNLTHIRIANFNGVHPASIYGNTFLNSTIAINVLPATTLTTSDLVNFGNALGLNKIQLSTTGISVQDVSINVNNTEISNLTGTGIICDVNTTGTGLNRNFTAGLGQPLKISKCNNGIRLNNRYSTNIQNSIFEDIPGDGIYSNNGRGGHLIQNNEFKRIGLTSAGSSAIEFFNLIEIQNCWILNNSIVCTPITQIGRGIYIQNTVPSYDVNVRINDNTIDLKRRAIEVNSAHGVPAAFCQIYRNTILNTPFINSSTIVCDGIYLNQCKNYEVWQNTLSTGPYISTTQMYPMGIHATGNSSNGDHDFTCNSTLDYNRHIEVEGSFKVRLGGNIMDGRGIRGVSINGSNQMGIQGNINQSSDNQWNPTTGTLTNSIYYDNLSNCNAFAWYYRSFPAFYNPTSSIGFSFGSLIHNPFAPVNQSQFINCNVPSPLREAGSEEDSARVAADPNIPYSEYVDPTSAEYLALDNTNQWLIDERLVHLAYEEGVFAETYAEDIIGNTGRLFNAFQHQIYMLNMAFTTGDLTLADQHLANLNPTNLIEQNYTEVFAIYRNTFALEVFELDSVQVAALQAIATQCARNGGNGVTIARNMLDQTGNEYLESECEEVSSEKANIAFTPTSEIAIEFYPNPVEGVLFIQEIHHKSTELQVEVYNTMGTKIRVEQVSLPASLSTLDLKPGIYQIVVKEYNGTVVKSQKLMCIK